MKLEFSRRIFEKYLHIKFNKNPFSRSGLFYADRQTDRHDEALRNLRMRLQIVKNMVKALPISHDTEKYLAMNETGRNKPSEFCTLHLERIHYPVPVTDTQPR
jgi:hypothetical protein